MGRELAGPGRSKTGAIGPQKGALLVGISRYPQTGANPWRPLNTHQDVVQLKEALVAQGFAADNVKILEDGAAECKVALPACERLLDMVTRTASISVADEGRSLILNRIARCEQKLGSYPAAEGHQQAALVILQRLYGSEHPRVADSLNSLAWILEEQGKYGQAERLYRQALAMRQKLPDAEHLDIAWDLYKLANALRHQAKYAQAEPLYRQALAMRQKLQGVEHLEVAWSLANLAAVLVDQGKYEEAEALYRQALAMNQKLLGAEHKEVASSLDDLARLLERQGQYQQAEELYRQSLAMKQKLLGAEHKEVARSLDDLARVRERQGQYRQAEELYRQALAMRQKLLGAEHSEVAQSLRDLGYVLVEQGKYGQAEALYRQALAIQQKLLGAEQSEVAQILFRLGHVLLKQGKQAQATELYRQAVAIYQKLPRAESRYADRTINLLANMFDHFSASEIETMETLYRQLLAVEQDRLGTEHPQVATHLDVLASLLIGQDKYAQAETLSRQALIMQQKLLGADHPDIASSLDTLAISLTGQGQYDQAETLSRQALGMRQRLLDAEHPLVAQSLNNLGLVLLYRHQLPAALPLFAQAARIQENLLRLISSETRMRSALEDLRTKEELLYGLLLEQPTDADLQRLALTTALLRKGRAADAGTVANRLLQQSRNDPRLRTQFEQWQDLRAQRETLLFGSGGQLPKKDYRARVRALDRRAEDLESQLAVALPELRKLQPPTFDAILPAVAARLPKDGILIEVVWARPHDFKTQGQAPRTTAAHYIAMVLSPEQRIVVRDLGEAVAVDQKVQALLGALRNLALDPKLPAQQLYQQILSPLLPPGAAHLYLSLDGALSFIPFDALHDGTDYLLGRKSIHYLTSGRDLLQRLHALGSAPAEH